MLRNGPDESHIGTGFFFGPCSNVLSSNKGNWSTAFMKSNVKYVCL